MSDRTSRFVRLMVFVTLTGALFGGSLVKPSAALAGGSGSELGSNGQHRRPFYNFGHNPNQLGEVSGDLVAGANALEPDVMRFSDAAISPDGTHINTVAGDSGLFMYHDSVLVTTRMPDTVENWLEFVHTKIVGGSNVAMIAFDIKSPAAHADLGAKLLLAVHSHLNYDGVNVNVIFSVGGRGDGAVFGQIIPNLGAREGVMIDAENDPISVFNYFNDRGAYGHIAYGNGSLGFRYGFAPHVLLGIEQASWARAGQVPVFTIPYAYPMDLASDMNALITAGADGLIPDRDLPITTPSDTQEHIRTLDGIINSRNDIYLATAREDPFHPPVEAYALRVHTQDNFGAGTDSNITFTLTGCNGTSSVTIDTSFIGHMERDDVNYLTLPSKDLGRLQSLTLSSDGSGLGPSWDPGQITISSANWGIPYRDGRSVTFSSSVTASDSQTMTLGGWGHPCESATTVASSANPSVFGQPVTLTAIVKSVSPSAGTPTGIVTFLDGTTPIGSGTLVGGSIAVTTAALSVASHSITAQYLGDSSFLASASVALNQAVNRAATTTSLSSSVNPSVFGQPVTVTATVAPVSPGAGTPTGPVSFFDGSTPMGSGTLVGGAATVTTAALSVASHSITAQYLGDSSFLASASVALNQAVNRAATMVSLTAHPSGATGFGKPVTFTAQVNVPPPGAGAPTGPVVFAVDGTTVQTASLNANEQAAVTTSALGPGVHVISASYLGDGNFLAKSTTLGYQVTCTVTITGNHPGAVLASGASTCIVNGTVGGSIMVPKGTSLAVENSIVGGSITANNMPNAIRICGSSVIGVVSVIGAQGLVVIGDPGDANCAVNKIGSLMLRDNTNGVEAINNRVRNLHLSNNSGPGPYLGDVTTIGGNTP